MFVLNCRQSHTYLEIHLSLWMHQLCSTVSLLFQNPNTKSQLFPFSLGKSRSAQTLTEDTTTATFSEAWELHPGLSGVKVNYRSEQTALSLSILVNPGLQQALSRPQTCRYSRFCTLSFLFLSLHYYQSKLFSVLHTPLLYSRCIFQLGFYYLNMKLPSASSNLSIWVACSSGHILVQMAKSWML